MYARRILLVCSPRLPVRCERKEAIMKISMEKFLPDGATNIQRRGAEYRQYNAGMGMGQNTR